MRSDHEHPVDAARVRRARTKSLGAEQANQLAALLSLLADPVRARILFALNAVEELCVGDLALALGVSEDAVSYALKLLRTARLVRFRKDGRVVYYRLADGFPHQLLDHCLRELVSISRAPRGGIR